LIQKPQHLSRSESAFKQTPKNFLRFVVFKSKGSKNFSRFAVCKSKGSKNFSRFAVFKSKGSKKFSHFAVFKFKRSKNFSSFAVLQIQGLKKIAAPSTPKCCKQPKIIKKTSKFAPLMAFNKLLESTSAPRSKTLHAVLFSNPRGQKTCSVYSIQACQSAENRRKSSKKRQKLPVDGLQQAA
jgi:hypothetical protein